jgi:hypothetical protein
MGMPNTKIEPSAGVDSRDRDLEYYENRIAALESSLKPFYARDRELKDALIRTFPYRTTQNDWGYDTYFVTAYTRDGAERRFGLHAERDRLHETHGPAVTKLKNLKIERDGLVKAMERMRKAKRR